MTQSILPALPQANIAGRKAVLPSPLSKTKGNTRVEKKQLKKVEAQAKVALEKCNERDNLEHVQTELSQDPNLESYEMTKMAFLGIPLMMTGICGPTFMALTSDIALPDYTDTMGMCLAICSAIGMMSSNITLWQGRMIKHKLKYTLGQELPRHKIKAIRVMQKGLGLGERISLPASDVFDDPAISDVTSAKDMELSLIITPYTIRLQWTKPLPTAALWDRAMDNLVEAFDLKDNTSPQRQLTQSFTHKMILKMDQNA